MTPPPLLTDPRFAPMFWAQFTGAYLDNVFRGALIALAMFGTARPYGLDAPATIAASGVALILPFALLSGTAGELADAQPRGLLVRAIKVIEVPVVAACVAALVLGRYEVLLIGIGLLGGRAALFGPVKYAILPDLVGEDRLTAANGLVQASTWVAILAGTLVGAAAIATPGVVAASALFAVALGLTAAFQVPPGEETSLPVRWDQVRPAADSLRLAAANPNVFQAILGKAWFWALGSVVLGEIPAFTRDVVRAPIERETTWLVCLAAGAMVGAALATRLSRRRVELGLVPLGSLGLSLCTLAVALPGPTAWHALTFVGIGVAGAVFAVPLAAYVQWRSVPAERARVVAGANIIDAIAIVAATAIWLIARQAGLGTVGVFVAIAVVNAGVAVYIYSRVPEFLLRFLAWCLSNVLYRLTVTGLEHIPRDGPAVIVCNHVTFVDWLIVGGAVRRPVRFVMYAGYEANPLFRFVTRQARVIPIAGAKEDPAVLERAMDAVARELDAGELVGIFPEGHLTPDGKIAAFRRGIERVVARNPVPVVPLALNGLWGSFFSRQGGPAMSRPPRRFWSQVWLTASAPIPPEVLTAKALEDRVSALWNRFPDRP